jgi:hypothetical protein
MRGKKKHLRKDPISGVFSQTFICAENCFQTLTRAV